MQNQTRVNPMILPQFPVRVSIAATSSSSSTPSSNGGDASFTTLKEPVTSVKVVKKSKFIAIATPISNERSAFSFLSQVRDPRARHNCWAYKVGDQFRCSDDGEPCGTAGKPIFSAIVSSGIDGVMVVVVRYFGGIKLGTGGLARAYGGVRMGLEIPFDLVGLLNHQLQSFQVEDI